jgi:catechol 2,3-dioxygenase-like lactoylglutathione lyase family enzyme
VGQVLQSLYPDTMEQRVSLITLGVTDTSRARDFYEALGWKGVSPDGDVVFLHFLVPRNAGYEGPMNLRSDDGSRETLS